MGRRIQWSNGNPALYQAAGRRGGCGPRTIEGVANLSMLGCLQRQPFHLKENMMTQSKSSGKQNKQSANMSEDDISKAQAGKADKSSQNAKSRVKAGTGEGAGGGAKQKAKH
jgi:hypothetical protein